MKQGTILELRDQWQSRANELMNSAEEETDPYSRGVMLGQAKAFVACSVALGKANAEE